MTGDTLLRTFSVARKELLHIIRDPQTLFFTIFVPVLELFMLGYAIDTNVRNVRTAIVDYAGTQESRQLLEKFEKSQDFRIVARAHSDTRAILRLDEPMAGQRHDPLRLWALVPFADPAHGQNREKHRHHLAWDLPHPHRRRSPTDALHLESVERAARQPLVPFGALHRL